MFLITCLTGHPLLVSEVAYPFWMLFGVMTALAGATLLSDTSRAGGSRASWSTPPALRWLAAAAAIVILVASPIATATGAVIPSASRAVNGLFEWERWRTARGFAGPAATRACSCRPTSLAWRFRSVCRLTAAASRSMGVEAMTGGVDRGRTMVDASWAIISLPLTPVLPPIRFKRIDLTRRSRLAAGAVHRRQRGHAQGRRAGRRTAALPRIAPRRVSAASPATSSKRAPAIRTSPSRRSAARDRWAAAGFAASSVPAPAAPATESGACLAART